MQTSSTDNQKKNLLILYDGNCGLCNKVVQFVIARDPNFLFNFAALDSNVAQEQMRSHDYDQPLDNPDSFVLIDGDNLYDRSSAGLHLMRALSYPYKLLFPLILVPKFLRDPFYNLIARNRHRWFPAPDSCQIPEAKDALRFLDR